MLLILTIRLRFSSSLVTKVLMDSFTRRKRFSVVVVDARPRNEGMIASFKTDVILFLIERFTS